MFLVSVIFVSHLCKVEVVKHMELGIMYDLLQECNYVVAKPVNGYTAS